MLQPSEIKNKEFTYTKGFYKAEEVNLFLEQISYDYQNLFSLYEQLKSSNEKLAIDIENYKSQEKMISSVLISAQSDASKTISKANDYAKKTKEKADLEASDIIFKAENKADKIIKDLKSERQKLKKDISSLQSQYNKLNKELSREYLKTKTKLINNLKNGLSNISNLSDGLEPIKKDKPVNKNNQSSSIEQSSYSDTYDSTEDKQNTITIKENISNDIHNENQSPDDSVKSNIKPQAPLKDDIQFEIERLTEEF